MAAAKPGVRLAELIASLSLATDLGLGQPQEHVLRQTVIASRLGSPSSDVGCPEGQLGFHGIGNWTVSGGTGRFAGIGGTGTFDGHSDFIAGTFEITLSGTITH